MHIYSVDLNNESYNCANCYCTTPKTQHIYEIYLHDGVGGHDFLLILCFCLGTAHCGEVAHGIFRRYRFTRTRLSTDDDGLVFAKPTDSKRNSC